MMKLNRICFALAATKVITMETPAHKKKDNKMRKRGALIVLEGCDGSGKTTQCKKLVATLRDKGHKVEGYSSLDRSTAIGGILGDYMSKKLKLNGRAVHLLFCANAWETIPTLKEKIEDGVTIVMDRYAYSGIAYRAAAEGFSHKWCKHGHVGNPRPDLAVFLDIPIEEASKRIAERQKKENIDKEIYEKKEIQRRVYQQFEILIAEDDSYWKKVDASKAEEEVHTELTKQAIECIESDLPPLAELWTENRGV